MNITIKDNKGITLMALVITIIILLILLTVGIGTATGIKSNIMNSKETIAKSDLAKVQQAVTETYIRYKQSGDNERVLYGIKLSYTSAKTSFDRIGSSESLKSVYSESETDASKYYYKLEKIHLKQMGLEDLGEDEYIVNYSTGEAFNIVNYKTGSGYVLYTYAK